MNKTHDIFIDLSSNYCLHGFVLNLCDKKFLFYRQTFPLSNCAGQRWDDVDCSSKMDNAVRYFMLDSVGMHFVQI